MLNLSQNSIENITTRMMKTTENDQEIITTASISFLLAGFFILIVVNFIGFKIYTKKKKPITMHLFL